jgi:hypothetical protein
MKPKDKFGSARAKLMAKIEEYIQKYPSIRKWFIEADGQRRFEPSTEEEYIEYIDLFCRLAGCETPDQLANCEDIDKVRGVIAEGMSEKLKLKDRSVAQRTNALNSFWRKNDRKVKDVYGGISGDLGRRIKREAKRSLVVIRREAKLA